MEATLAEETVATAVVASIPENLPVAVEPIVGYGSFQDQEESEDLNALENQAHAKKVLLSSDAMRYFIGKVASKENRTTMLDAVIGKARVLFPSEDGWVVINLSRMESIIDEVNIQHDELVNDAPVELSTVTGIVPMTAGSLAEAIVSGNTLASYEMISHRPMVALADAAADFDAVYRTRKGEIHTVSNLLKNETEKLSDEQLSSLIVALTSALDGTYKDEESAVKMAILKAIKILG